MFEGYIISTMDRYRRNYCKRLHEWMNRRFATALRTRTIITTTANNSAKEIFIVDIHIDFMKISQLQFTAAVPE